VFWLEANQGDNLLRHSQICHPPRPLPQGLTYIHPCAIWLWKFTTYWVNPCWKGIILISNYTWNEYQYLLLSIDEYGKF
jgi:hypothetical protein